MEGGSGLLIGALPTTGLARDSARPTGRDSGGGRRAASQRDEEAERARPTPQGTANAIREVWQRIGLPPASCAEQVVITPACGLAGVSPDQARDALRWCREAARILPELMEELA